MMNNIRQALTRKIGPLPAWVYALIFGVAAYLYRRRNTAKAQVVLDPATQPGVMDSQTPQDPVHLSPGESVYNPNTGQLVGTAPEQFPPNPPADRPLPITLEPGESLYDPATGQFIDPNGPATTTGGTTTKKKPKKIKRRAKAKPHQKAKHKPAKHTSRAHKSKPRSNAHLHRGARPKPTAGKPAPKPRTRTMTPAARKPAPRPAAHAAARPAVRQHTTPVRSAPPAHRAPAPPPRRRR